VPGRIDTMPVVGGHGTETAMTDDRLLTQAGRGGITIGADLARARLRVDPRDPATHFPGEREEWIAVR
jgi:hypothetical protein